ERESILEPPPRPAPAEEGERDSILDSPPTEAAAPQVKRIRYRCPHCNLRLRAPETAVGKTGRCPRRQKSAPVAVPSVAIPAPELRAAPVAPAGYELLGELGKGAFGVVYKARHLQLNRIVALKVMRPDVDPDVLPRFRIEAQAVARMQHSNIVQIF